MPSPIFDPFSATLADPTVLGLSELAQQWLIRKPITVVVIVVVAVVVRLVAHRAIDRLTRPPSLGARPALLRPLRERGTRVDDRGRTAAMQHERRTQRATTIGSVLKSITSVVVLTFAVIYVLRELGLDIAPLLASAGIVGVALGFGAQNLVRDFLSGIFMILEDQYGVGDVIDTGEATGVVESVGLRVTVLRDVPGTVWYVRNGEVQRIGNKSQGYAVAVIDLPLAHTTDVDDASDVALETATTSVTEGPLAELVLAPPEVLGVESVTADTVTLRLTVKVKPGKQWAVQRTLNQRILDEFDERGIRPPYPQGRPLGGLPTPSP
ncbi:mechanosensitive ion channel [Rhodococcus aerolatus]